MKRSEFQFDLPETLVAQQPLAARSASRLLHLGRESGRISHHHFSDLAGFLRPGDLLVRNNTRVIPARLFARKESGGRVEIMIERLVSDRSCIAQLRSSKTPKAGALLILENGQSLELTGRQDSFFELKVSDEGADLPEVMSELGHMPLPPYIRREDTTEDRERYQTVYAKTPGAVAAPTAGLHFDQPLLDKLVAMGVESTEVTLHVGAGTFQPVRTEDIEDHEMHSEFLQVSSECCDAVKAAKQRGSRVIAVGTTAVRSLETAAAGGDLEPYSGDSRLFI
jgi:S-adenosylmethionine:tRNA ribosyltransferase-isomerase